MVCLLLQVVDEPDASGQSPLRLACLWGEPGKEEQGGSFRHRRGCREAGCAGFTFLAVALASRSGKAGRRLTRRRPGWRVGRQVRLRRCRCCYWPGPTTPSTRRWPGSRSTTSRAPTGGPSTPPSSYVRPIPTLPPGQDELAADHDFTLFAWNGLLRSGGSVRRWRSPTSCTGLDACTRPTPPGSNTPPLPSPATWQDVRPPPGYHR